MIYITNMPRRPETPSNQEIIDKIESLKPVVQRAAQRAGENLWGIPNMGICPQIEYREAKDWLSMPSPLARLADCLAAYYKLPLSKLARYSGTSPEEFDSLLPSSAQQAGRYSASRNKEKDKVGVNLTAVREQLKLKKRTANLNDPITSLAIYILVHENFIHANCQSKPINGEERKNELIEWAQALCRETGEDGEIFLPHLQRQGIKIENRGTLLEYIFDPNMGPLVIGHYFDELLAHTISTHAFASIYSSITGESTRKSALVYLNLMSVPDQVKDEDFRAAFDFYKSDEPTAVRNYFSGDFFTKYVLSLTEEERTEILLQFFICNFASFYKAITPKSNHSGILEVTTKK